MKKKLSLTSLTDLELTLIIAALEALGITLRDNPWHKDHVTVANRCLKLARKLDFRKIIK